MADTVRSILTEEIGRLKNTIQERMASEKANASGGTSASLKVVISEDTGVLMGSKTFLWLEQGRGPGKVPMGFQDIIKAWIKNKGINYSSYIPKGRKSTKMDETKRLNAFAGAIAWTIIKKGTLLHRTHARRDIYDTAINETLANINERIGNMLGNAVDLIHTQAFSIKD